MAKRYCGTLALDIKYVANSDSYDVRITEVNDGARFQTLRLWRWISSTWPTQTKEAYDRVARAAVSFAGYDDEAIYIFAECDPDTGEAIIRRRLV
jgi:hypothetical protein